MEFEVGDHVYPKLWPYRQKSLAHRQNEKLAARYFGPFEVLARIGAMAYKLRLPPTTIHSVFHVLQLRKVVGDLPISPSLLETLTAGFELIVELEA